MKLTPLQLLQKELRALEIEQRKLNKASGVENRMKRNTKLIIAYTLAISVLQAHPNFHNATGSTVTGSGKNEI